MRRCCGPLTGVGCMYCWVWACSPGLIFSEQSLEWHRRVARELFQRYGGHASFYGWYVSEEIMGDLYYSYMPHSAERWKELAVFFREFRTFVQELAPTKPVAFAPNNVRFHLYAEEWKTILPFIDILIPFAFARDPEHLNVVQMKQICDECGTHMWVDMEMFREPFEDGLVPKTMEALLREIRQYDALEQCYGYQYTGLMNHPASRFSLGGSPQKNCMPGIYNIIRRAVLHGDMGKNSNDFRGSKKRPGGQNRREKYEGDTRPHRCGGIGRTPEAGIRCGSAAASSGKASGSCDALLALSQRIKEAPIRQDWPYEEPDDLESVMAACDPTRRREASRLLSDGEIEARVRSAFLTSVCACILGKPLEEAPYGGLEDIRAAAQASGEWPLRDYVSDAMLTAWGRRNPSWVETTRGRVRYAASDDDITYTIMGMLLIEKRGRDFSHEDMRQLWLENLPIYLCWGPERTVLLRAGLAVLAPDLPYDMDDWAARLNPGQELCGAMIRADAYGYACPGDPELAARLAFRDASFTHRKTGVYSAMFVAAAIAAAFTAENWKEIVVTALQYVPQRSRFYEQASTCLRMVDDAASFEDGYNAVHTEYGAFGAGQVVQEIGTVINTLKFARDVEEGIGMQVAQGNDSDSFACSCGSILGAYFADGLPEHWYAQFNNTIHTTMGNFHETDLQALTKRMQLLYKRVRQPEAPLA